MNNEFTPGESLRLITNMIEKTRKGISDSSPYFLIWGWGTFLACISEFILKVYIHSPYYYCVWLILIPCAILSAVIGARTRKIHKVRTYLSDTMKLLWSALGITFFVMIIIFSKIGWQYCYPFFIMLYGLGTFISGKLVKFTPLVAGGIICWVLAIVASYLSYNYQLLATAAALLVSYIIPGHLLRLKFKNQD